MLSRRNSYTEPSATETSGNFSPRFFEILASLQMFGPFTFLSGCPGKPSQAVKT
jgi:hypothetical protein